MAIKIKDGGTWRTLKVPYVKDGGTWRKCHLVYVKDGGSWREAHRTLISSLTQSGPYTQSNGGSYTVPAGVRYLKFIIIGASGGGAGAVAAKYDDYWCNSSSNWYRQGNVSNTGRAGGDGGTGEKIDVTFEVVPGEVYSFTVGTAGSGGSGAWGRAYVANTGIYNYTYYANSNQFSTLYSTAGGAGNYSRVSSGSRNINFTAAGGDGGSRAGLTFSTTATWCSGDSTYAWSATPSYSGGGDGSNKTSEHQETGTNADGTDISNSRWGLTSTIGHLPGGAGGDSWNTASNADPSDVESGAAGTAGSIQMYTYS